MKPQKLFGMVLILVLSIQVFGEPQRLNYDREPCPVMGFDYLCKQIKCSYSDSWCDLDKTVKLSFRIDADGAVSRFRVLLSAGEAFDQLAIQGVSSVEWQPAIIEGQKIPVRFQLPIQFCKR